MIATRVLAILHMFVGLLRSTAEVGGLQLSSKRGIDYSKFDNIVDSDDEASKQAPVPKRTVGSSSSHAQPNAEVSPPAVCTRRVAASNVAKPIDYSKWDNIDDVSDEDEERIEVHYFGGYLLCALPARMVPVGTHMHLLSSVCVDRFERTPVVKACFQS